MFDPLAFLRSVGLACGSESVAEPLAGGYWNQVFRVRGDGRDLVVKHFGGSSVESSLFPVLPDDEARALDVLAGRGVAPDPVGYYPAGDDHGPVLVYTFFAGQMWDGDVAEAAELLSRIHSVDTAGFRSMPASPSAILDDADRLPRPPGDDGNWRRLLDLRPAIAIDEAPAKRVLVHGDFSAGNMIAGPDGVRCIDWQCPGMGDAAEDLWSFLSPAFQILYDREPYDGHAVARFRLAYGDDGVLARLDLLSPCLSYRFAHYCCFRTHQLAEVDPVASDRYARATIAELDVLARHQAVR